VKKPLLTVVIAILVLPGTGCRSVESSPCSDSTVLLANVASSPVTNREVTVVLTRDKIYGGSMSRAAAFQEVLRQESLGRSKDSGAFERVKRDYRSRLLYESDESVRSRIGLQRLPENAVLTECGRRLLGNGVHPNG